MRVSSTLAKLFLSGLIVLATVPVAFSQGGRGGGGPGGGRGGFGGFGGNSLTGLVGIKEVRDELKVDEVQGKEIDEIAKELGDSQRELFSGFGGRQGGGGPPDDATRQRMQENMEKIAKLQQKADEKLNDVLDPKQMDRLLGLFVQRSLTSAIAHSQISAKLKISDEQKTKLKELEDARRASRGGPGGGAGGGGGGGFDPQRFEQQRKESEEKVLAVLSADQKKTLEDMKGAKFEFPAPNFGGRRGGNNN